MSIHESLLIRSISPRDFDDMYDLYMDESVNPFMVYDPMGKNEFQKVFEEFMKRDYSWLIEHNGKIIGMCFAVKGIGRYSHVATLLSLAIRNDVQGQGLGKKLVGEALRVLKEDGFLRVDLGMETDNSKGIVFYKSMGFSIDGRMPKYIYRNKISTYVDVFLMSIIYEEAA